MSNTETKTYEVVLNGPALGIAEGENVKRIEADRFESDVNANRVTFYVGDEPVALFSHALAISVVS